MLAPGHRIAGRYRLARLLAQGGMGSVWVAHDQQLGRDVAVKVMTPAAFALPELVARFEREAKAAAQLRSAHAVQIFDHGLDGGAPFIVMELLDGEDLSVRMRRLGRMGIDAAYRVAGDVCKALRRAHEMGIVHRDLKPANIFLARQDDEEVVKVLDFGVAKLSNAEVEMTSANALLGTPHYMAPEQARKTGVPVDHRADLWALGVVVFRMLTGRLPFPGESQLEILIAVVSEPVPIPSSIAPDLGPEVDRFFAIALARDPAARFQSALAFREALGRLAYPAANAARHSSPSGWDLPIHPQVATVPLAIAPAAPAIHPPAAPAVSAPVVPPAVSAPVAPPAATSQRAPFPQPADSELDVAATIPLPKRAPVPAAQPAPAAKSTHAQSPGAKPHFFSPTMKLGPPVEARGSEQTPPALASTAASGGEPPHARRTGIHWVVFAAAGASVLVLLIVIVVGVMGSVGGQAAAAPSGKPVAPTAAPSTNVEPATPPPAPAPSESASTAPTATALTGTPPPSATPSTSPSAAPSADPGQAPAPPTATPRPPVHKPPPMPGPPPF